MKTIICHSKKKKEFIVFLAFRNYNDNFFNLIIWRLFLTCHKDDISFQKRSTKKTTITKKRLILDIQVIICYITVKEDLRVSNLHCNFIFCHRYRKYLFTKKLNFPLFQYLSWILFPRAPYKYIGSSHW